jgi:hypothetical protein
MAYLYRHIRLDKNEPFYIGIGSDENYERAYNNHNRSIFWKNIINKTPYEIEIILDDLTWEEAYQKEIEFIALYGRVNLNLGSLVNLTDGGEGAYGRKYIVTEETKQKLRKPKHSEEQKHIWSILRKGKPNPNGWGKGKPKPSNSKKHKGRISPNKGKGKQVALYDITTNKHIKTYPSYYELAIDIQLNPETVRCQLVGKAKTLKRGQFRAQYV